MQQPESEWREDPAASGRTVGEVVTMMVDLGLIDPDTPARTFVVDCLDEPLTYFGDTDQSAVRELLSEVGIQYVLDYKTFRGIGESDRADRQRWYELELEAIARCARGMVAITDVRLVGDDSDQELRFECNGVTQTWPVRPGAVEEMEASLTFAECVTGLHTGITERFYSVGPAGLRTQRGSRIR
ncbi:hypothetical protein GV792_12485 [Nocardia cyriacigeorgica]|uniref:hypothetical protein n=1 Tax=Nocardia cyriacigeorgica TaxID=135487 RepID=UPI0013B5B164|nr:hypothetical protein [Nocardia cyriacigeorgica]NEW50878.1 hypothetical protein [Nocardia cyriacigeorgica]